VGDSIVLRNGDVLNLGGGLEIEIEIIDAKASATPLDAPTANKSTGSVAASSTGKQSAAAQTSNNSSIPTAVFFIAPALVLLLLVCGGGFLAFYGGGNGNNRNEEIVYDPTPDETPEKKSPTPRSSATVSGNSSTPAASPEETNAPETTSEKKKIEANSAAFLQAIALKDPNAFLNSSQVDLVAQKLAQFKNSNALAENFKAVKSNASQIKSLAESKGLKPQFLAIAALTEIGNSRGNPLETAAKMLPVFSELRVSLDNNLADDNLMIIAAYDQGKAGKFKDLRNALEALAKKNPSVSPREIRTIWFLRQQGKITEAEFDFALRFLAIGTIAQNPKDFDVNSDAVIFN
jgi:hypothetical protein